MRKAWSNGKIQFKFFQISRVLIKAGKEYVKTGNFLKAGKMYHNAASTSALDLAAKEDLYSKAEDCFRKPARLRSRAMYGNVARYMRIMKKMTLFKKIHSKAEACYAEAGEKYEKAANIERRSLLQKCRVAAQTGSNGKILFQIRAVLCEARI